MPRLWKAVYVDTDEDAAAFDRWVGAKSGSHIPSLDMDQDWEQVEENEAPEVLPPQEKLY